MGCVTRADRGAAAWHGHCGNGHWLGCGAWAGYRTVVGAASRREVESTEATTLPSTCVTAQATRLARHVKVAVLLIVTSAHGGGGALKSIGGARRELARVVAAGRCFRKVDVALGVASHHATGAANRRHRPGHDLRSDGRHHASDEPGNGLLPLEHALGADELEHHDRVVGAGVSRRDLAAPIDAADLVPDDGMGAVDTRGAGGDVTSQQGLAPGGDRIEGGARPRGPAPRPWGRRCRGRQGHRAPFLWLARVQKALAARVGPSVHVECGHVGLGEQQPAVDLDAGATGELPCVAAGVEAACRATLAGCVAFGHGGGGHVGGIGSDGHTLGIDGIEYSRVGSGCGQRPLP
eukprot:scaffold26650_cov63-Phaeocystis_antarctica.AAC.12